MIQDLFIPKKIDGYYLFAQDILGVAINKTHIRATLVTAQAKTITVKEYYEESLGTNGDLSYQERVAIALQALMARVGKKVSIRSALPGSLITFKQLVLPFTDPEKIRLILPLEIAPQLPFALENAIIDFMITGVDTAKNESTLLVAAVQKEQVAQHMALYAAAGIEPDAVTIDVFDIYGLYRMIPPYNERKGSTALIELQASSTRLMYLVDNKLERVRTINQGIAHLAKIVGQELNIENGDALEQVMRFGTGPHAQSNYTDAMHQAVGSLWQAVQFTLNSFADQTGGTRVDSILLLGSFATLPGICEYITERSGIECKPFNAQLIAANPTVVLERTVTPDQVQSLSTALPNQLTEQTTLLQEEFAPQSSSAFAQQVIAGGALAILLLSSLLGITLWQTSKLRTQERLASRAALNHLQELGLVDEDATSLTEAIDDATTKINKQENQWFPFSRQARTSLLHILQTLSASIDRASIGLQLKRLVITEDSVLIDGAVVKESTPKSFEALNTFLTELENSRLFTYIPREDFQDTTFNVKLILKKKKKGTL